MPTRSRASCEYDNPPIRHFALLPFIAVAASIASIGCGSTSSSTSVAPSPQRCAVTATPSPASFPASGGTGNLVVSSARECSWSVSSQAAWISLAPPTDGQGDGSVRYTVAANPAAIARRGTLALGSESKDITQEPASCRLELDRRSFELASREGTGTVDVRAPAGCAWTANAEAPWITIVEGTEGNGPGSVRFRVSANRAVEPRAGSLEIAGIQVEVRQLGTVAACSYELDPAGADTGPEQTEGSVAVSTDARCPWTAASDAAWLTIVDGASGSGAGQVRYRAAFNSTGANRAGRITVGASIFTLRQAPCSYSLDPASESFAAVGGRGRIDVQTQASCEWSANPTVSWIDITSRSSGLGNGRVDYEVGPNTRGARTGLITVSGQGFTVSQEAATSVAGSVSAVEGSCPNKRFVVRNQRVRTTSATVYERGRCRDVIDGVFLRVKGIVGNDEVLTAIEVDF